MKLVWMIEEPAQASTRPVASSEQAEKVIAALEEAARINQCHGILRALEHVREIYLGEAK